jgi:ABC-type transport system involved in cytochrome c biogenesis ATPase subunit
MKSKDTSLLCMSLLTWSLEELVDQGMEILEKHITPHQHQGGIVLVATHVPINLFDAPRVIYPS